MLHLQRHEELTAKTHEQLHDNLNVLASDATPLSGDWRAIVYCLPQRLCGDLAWAFGTAAHHGAMGTAESVDTLAMLQLGWRSAKRILFAMTAALAID